MILPIFIGAGVILMLFFVIGGSMFICVWVGDNVNETLGKILIYAIFVIPLAVSISWAVGELILEALK